MNDAQRTDIPYGYCQCGCGEKTNLAPCSSARLGYVKGQPQRFRHGHWIRVRERPDEATRFWAKVDKGPGHGPDGTCWLWTASRSKFGYGIFWIPQRRQMVLAHRWVFDREVAPLKWTNPPGITTESEIVRHSCDVRLCVNPAHLSVGSQQDNMDDMRDRGRRPNNKGTHNPRARLTEAQVEQARASFSGAYGEIAALARRYDVNHATMSHVLHGRTWT